ncbi:MAG: helicase-associated domain-containing protein [bacterium]|nr:helicase-associated domain-containing protein [bacterium]
MNLIDCLTVAPIEFLQSIASYLGATVKFNSKSDLIRQISIRLRNPKILAELIAGFNAETKLALRLMVYLGGIAGLPVQQLHQRLLERVQTNLLTPEQIIQPLIAHGLVYTGSTKSQHIPRYLIPQDIRIILIPILTADIQSHLIAVPQNEIYGVQLVQTWSILRDTFSFLSYVRRTPPVLSKETRLFKKTIQEIERLFEVNDKLPYPKDDYPTRLKLILNFCRSAQFIISDNLTWQVNEQSISHWFSLTKLEQLKSLYFSWIKNHFSTLPESSVILSILAGLPVSTWISISSLFEVARLIMPDQQWEKSYRAEINSYLFPGLFHLGFIALGKHKISNESLLALTELGKHLLLPEGKLPICEHKPTLILQPNFEILLDSNCPLQIRWEIELFADPIKVDRYITLRLNKRSVHRALEAEYTIKKILRILQSLSEKPLPQNVVYTLEEWEKQYGKIYFAEVFLLRCDNELLAKEIQSSVKFKPYILGVVSPKDLIINRKQYQKLVQLLKEEGYLPKAKIQKF